MLNKYRRIICSNSKKYKIDTVIEEVSNTRLFYLTKGSKERLEAEYFEMSENIVIYDAGGGQLEILDAVINRSICSNCGKSEFAYSKDEECHFCLKCGRFTNENIKALIKESEESKYTFNDFELKTDKDGKRRSDPIIIEFPKDQWFEYNDLSMPYVKKIEIRKIELSASKDIRFKVSFKNDNGTFAYLLLKNEFSLRSDDFDGLEILEYTVD